MNKMQICYEIPDTLPEAYLTEIRENLDKDVKLQTMTFTALAHPEVTDFKYDLIRGHVVINISSSEGAYAKRVLKRIYQNNLFNNILTIHVMADIVVGCDGITTLEELELALTDPV